MKYAEYYTAVLALRYDLERFTRWMWFDAIVVLNGVLTELVLPALGVDGEGLNVLKALRCVRIIRMFSMVEHLWTVSLTFVNSFQPMLWTVLFLMIIVGVFS